MPLNTLQDLVDDPSYHLGIQKSSSYESYFSSASSDSIRGKIYQDFISARPNNYVKNNEEGFNRVLDDPKYIYLVKKSTYINSKYVCQIEQSPRIVYKLQKGFIFRKGSPYKDLFNYKIGKLIEIGVIDKLTKKYVKTVDFSDCVSEVPVLGYPKLFTAFGVLVAGVVVCFGILVGEIILKCYDNKAKIRDRMRSRVNSDKADVFQHNNAQGFHNRIF